MVFTERSTRKRARPSQTSGVSVKKQKRDYQKDETSTLHTSKVLQSGTANMEPIRPSNTSQKSTSTHVRFGSEEPPLGSLEYIAEESEAFVAEDKEVDVTGDNTDSDDEAPEDVTASVATQASKAMSANIARAAKEQKMNDKRKRQEQAAHANEQAALSKRKSKAENKVEESFQDAEHDIVVEKNDSEDEKTPELLPEELLAQNFTRPPTPPPSSKRPKAEIQKKPRRVKLNFNTSTDRQVGPVKVRILQRINNLLPPKASSKSRAVREGWLAGRRSTGPLGMERKQFKGGFVKSS